MPPVNYSAEGDAHDDEQMEAANDAVVRHAAQGFDSGDDEDDDDYTDDDDSSVAPSVLDGLSSFSDYDEEHHGHDSLILENKHAELTIIVKMLTEFIKEDRRKNRKVKWELNRKIRKNEQVIKNFKIQLGIIPGPRQTSVSYEEVYRTCCKQENMAQKLTVFHPDFHLQNEIVKARHRRNAAEIDYLNSRLFLNIILPSRFFRLQPVSLHLLEWRPFPFERLPLEIQVKIFNRVFVKRSLIHCLSRLDPSNPPEDFPEEDEDGCSQLPARFHFGTSPCQILLAKRPNDVLKALLVCKRWYFIGVHAFYGANTFAFSSLGEWHRFCNGIGRARVERLVNVELMWHGALMPRHGSRISRRSLGLAWFTKMRRLRTLVVHIQECPKDRMRRKYEKPRKRRLNPNAYEDQSDGEPSDVEELNDKGFESYWARHGAHHGNGDGSDDDEYPFKASNVKFDPFKTMMQRTAKQPQFRRYRSMRTVQGMDYIYQLRGMKWVRFKERDGTQHRQEIRDWSFLKDINTVVTIPKQRQLALESELENLQPLAGLEDWIPSDQDIQIIKTFYDESPILGGMVYGSETSESSNEDMSNDDTSGDSDSDDDRNRKAQPRQIPNRQNRPRNDDHSDSDSNAGSDVDTEPNSDNDDGDWPSSQQPHDLSPQQRDDDTTRMDIDDDDRSSNLFVSSGSGSAGDPLERMGAGQDDANGAANARMLGGSGQSNNPLLRQLSDLAGAESSNRIIIDLTGDDDEDDDTESSLFVQSRPPTPSVKTEPSDMAIDLTMPDNKDGEENADPDDDFDDTRFIDEETPPGSDDESDSDLYPSLRNSAGVHSFSSKRSSNASIESDDSDGPPAKRPRRGRA
ncbi:hypothetical protein F5Y13DRAFT_202295 [Hypoxylon sp. FL1857]|nr:hypothetical protein F5Y13DRAFT_202295 [Hypoxylon sp. FL1857]